MNIKTIEDINLWSKNAINYYILYNLSRDIGFYTLFEEELLKKLFNVDNVNNIPITEYTEGIEKIKNLIESLNTTNGKIYGIDLNIKKNGKILKKILNLIDVSDITVADYITFSDFFDKYTNIKSEDIENLESFITEFENDLNIILNILLKKNIPTFKKLILKLFGYKIIKPSNLKNDIIFALIVFFLKLIIRLFLKKINMKEKNQITKMELNK